RQHYQGGDDPERIRNFIKDAYALWGTDYVVLGGDHRAVPSRIALSSSQSSSDPPSDWYYACLDGSWNREHDSTYEWSHGLIPKHGDMFPEVWVGRLPARDTADVEAMVDKILTYEQAPGMPQVTDGGYYSRATLAAGLTNRASWGPDDDDDAWRNGIYYAEQVRAQAFVPNGITDRRLYPYLGGDVSTCGGQTLPCYDTIKAAVSPYPPIANTYFTASTLFSELNGASKPGFLFHVEHSNPHILGGPVDPVFYPDIQNCLQMCPDPPFCDDWRIACGNQYTSHERGAFAREYAQKLTNGPHYFVGFSYGSLTGRHDRDAIHEVLLRNPVGGAVAMCGKATSATDGPYPVAEGGAAWEIGGAFFNSILEDHRPIGVAFSDAVTTFQRNDAGGNAHRRWHLFGDPAMPGWSASPSELNVVATPADLGAPGVKSFQVTVTDVFTTSAVSGARVCLYRANDVFASLLSDESGIARFPYVLLPTVDDTVQVHVTAHNYIPAVLDLPPTTVPTTKNALSYFNHTRAETLMVGAMPDTLEAGEQISLAVGLRANRSMGGGTARLTPSPRLRAILKRADAWLPAERFFIGGGNGHPPGPADTIQVAPNEYGCRVEGTPTATTLGAVYLWRDASDIYHLKVKYDAADVGVAFSGAIISDGGVSVVSSTGVEWDDSFGAVNGAVDCVTFSLIGDATDDEILFRGEAPDWVTVLNNTDTYGSLVAGQVAYCRYRLQFSPTVPPRTRVNFTVTGAGTFSDFYLAVAAPSLELTFLDRAELPGETCATCSGPADAKTRLVPTVRNLGDATAANVELRLWEPSGSGVTVCKPAFVAAIRPGAHRALAEGFEFCDPSNDVVLDSITAYRTVNGSAYRMFGYAAISPRLHDRQVSSILVDPLLDGLRVSWAPPADTVGIRGYRAYVDSTGTDVWVPTNPLNDATTLWLRGRLPAVTYRVGVAAIDQNFMRGPLLKSTSQRTNLVERTGWPKRVPKGGATSLALVDLDGDIGGSSEIVVGGSVLSAFKGDGTSATSSPTGLLYDPYPLLPAGSKDLYFRGEIAAANIDNDSGKIVEIVGTYGDGKVYAVRENGMLYWSKPCVGLAGATLADIDKTPDARLEVLVNSYTTGSLYVFKHDGNAFAGGNSVFHDLSADPVAALNFAGVAVGNLDADPQLEIVQPSRSGTVYALNTNGTQLWNTSLIATGNHISTPAVGKVSGSSQPHVAVNTNGTFFRSTVLDGLSGAPTFLWDGLAFPDLNYDEKPVQSPALADLNGEPDGALEIVVPQRNTLDGDPTNIASLLYRVGTTSFRATALDSLPLPGRTEEVEASLVGSVVIVDLEGDGTKEIVAVSAQGAAFSWEVIWSAETSTFECRAKKGWPLVFDERPGTAAVGNIDSDPTLELVVVADDGYIHTYDLPGLAASHIYWGASGHDARRTGNYDAGPIGPSTQPNPGDDLKHDRRPQLSAGTNPSVAPTRLAYQVPDAMSVRIDIVDVSGRRVRTIEDRAVPAGSHVVEWDGRDERGARVPAGVYFAMARMGTMQATRKLVIGR
ncbi:MAG: hypothetical protein IT349_11760, partial [Candidatus Eisenbacteria bacterium]|nr:hypothetical protein [Candidatus Eisenbacteria bacterium]